MSKEIEKRFVQIRSADKTDEGKMIAEGRAIVYNSETRLWEDMFEVIAPGASTETLKNDDIRAVWNHNLDIVLGRSKNNTLKLSESDKGVDVKIEFPDTEEGRSKFASIQRGDIDGMSFGFKTLDENWSKRTNEENHEEYVRTITRLRILEVSPCTFPAYEDTEIQARSKDLVTRCKSALGETSPENEPAAVGKAEFEILEARQKLYEKESI